MSDARHPFLLAMELTGGIRVLAAKFGLTAPALRKWLVNRRMPRTEWTGETTYSATVEELTEGKVTKEMLLTTWPVWSGFRAKSGEPAVEV